MSGGTIRILPIDGTWQTLGRGTLISAAPENILPTWNAHGPDTLGFDLSVDAIRSTIELREFTPVDYITRGDEPLWSGYVFDAPRRSGGAESGVTVSCRGWQYHTQEDAHASLYVHRTMADWNDTRGYPSNPTQLARFNAASQVLTDGGSISLVFPKGTPIDADVCVGVTIDQGPDPEAWCSDFDLVGEAIGAGLSTNHRLYVRVSDSIETIVSTGTTGEDRHDAVSAATSIVAWGGTLIPSSAPRRRYITVMIVRNPASGSTTATQDEGIRLTTIILYRQSAYRASSESTLTANQIFVAETLRCPLLSTDTSRIQASTFKIASFGALLEEATPYDLMTRADSYHRFRWGVDSRRRGYFQPQPAVPELSVNTRDPGVDYQDTSHNSGEDVYNKVIVVGQTGDGKPLRIVRFSSQLSNVDYLVPAGVTVPNGSFTTNTTGWVKFLASSTATLTRDTGVFDSSPASGRIDVPISQTAQFRRALTGTFAAGLTYRASIRVRGSTFQLQDLVLKFGAIEAFDYASSTMLQPVDLDSAAFKTFTVAWSPATTTAAASFEIFSYIGPTGSTRTGYFDNLTITAAVLTMPDRRGFTRSKTLDVQSPTSEAAMQLLGDLFLEQYRRPLFKGSLNLSGPAVVDSLTGRVLLPHEVASRTGELIRLSDVVDPYTGVRGRDAVMVSAQASVAGTAAIALDNDRTSFEALLARMGIVQPRANVVHNRKKRN